MTPQVNEVVQLLAYPQEKMDALYRHKMECVGAAATLLAAIAPRPTTELVPEAQLESVQVRMSTAAAHGHASSPLSLSLRHDPPIIR